MIVDRREIREDIQALRGFAEQLGAERWIVAPAARRGAR